MSEQAIEVHTRTATGTNANRRLRQSGKIPAVVYGGGKDTVPVVLDRKTMVEFLKKGDSENAIFLLKLAGSGQERHAMIRDLQVDPLTHQVVHIDFQRILMTEKVRVRVEVHPVGTAYGVKNDGGILDFITRLVDVECLPADIPQHLELDVTELRVNQHLEVKDLKLPSGVAILDAKDKVLVSCTYSKAEQSTEAGEQLLEAAKAEPEVIKKGKPEDEKEKAEAAPKKK